jgi:hypothetical protein
VYLRSRWLTCCHNIIMSLLSLKVTSMYIFIWNFICLPTKLSDRILTRNGKLKQRLFRGRHWIIVWMNPGLCTKNTATDWVRCGSSLIKHYWTAWSGCRTTVCSPLTCGEVPRQTGTNKNQCNRSGLAVCRATQTHFSLMAFDALPSFTIHTSEELNEGDRKC